MNALEKRISQITVEPIIMAQNSRLRSLACTGECEESSPQALQYTYARYNELRASKKTLEEAAA